MQPLPPPVPGPMALLDTTEFVRRKKTALWFVGALLAVSASILTVGLAATTRTENVTVGGYYPGIILGFGSFLGIIGINLMENRKQMLVAAIVFISFGMVAAFCCAVVDGVFAARHIEPRPLMAGRCQFHSSGAGYLHDVHQTEVTCHSLNGGCPLKVKSNTCYCCDLYEPGVPLAQLAYGPSTAPRVLYDPAQQILACSGFRPRPPAIPTCSSYPLPLQLPGGFTASPLPEDSQPQPSSSCRHPLSAPTHLLPGEKPPPYTP